MLHFRPWLKTVGTHCLNHGFPRFPRKSLNFVNFIKFHIIPHHGTKLSEFHVFAFKKESRGFYGAVHWRTVTDGQTRRGSAPGPATAAGRRATPPPRARTPAPPAGAWAGASRNLSRLGGGACAPPRRCCALTSRFPEPER